MSTTDLNGNPFGGELGKPTPICAADCPFNEPTDAEMLAHFQLAGIHPALAAVPPLTGEEWQGLAMNIWNAGKMMHPCFVTPDAMLLDGRARLKASIAVGVGAWIVIAELGPNWHDWYEVVVALNCSRRGAEYRDLSKTPGSFFARLNS